MATLAGTLNVTSYELFTPAPGNAFTIMNFSSSTGSFASAIAQPAWKLTIVPSATSLALLSPALTPQTPNVIPVQAVEAALLVSVKSVSEAPVPEIEPVRLTAQPSLVSVDKPVEEEVCP